MSEDFTDPNRVHEHAQRERKVVVLAIVLTLIVGIGIGTSLSGGVRAFLEDHRIALVSNTGPAADMNLASVVANVAQQAEPAVVHISTIEQAQQGFDLFQGFGGGRRRASGSGIIVDAEGYILTNNHVVEGATDITVKFYDGAEAKGKVLGTDDETDLAVVKVTPRQPLTVARMGNSDQLRVGDWVIAIGSPFGLEQTVTVGIISAKERVTDGGSNFQNFLQTDAAINPGNSGGPLLNLRGEVVGINTQIATTNGNFNGIGFALPTTLAVDVYNQLVSEGRVRRGFLGITLGRLTPQISRQSGIHDGQGALIGDLSEGESPAANAGLKSGDIIVEFNHQKVQNERDLIRKVGATPVGASVPVKYWRDGKMLSTIVKLAERPPRQELAGGGRIVPQDPDEDDSKPQRSPNRGGEGKSLLGIAVESHTPDRASRLGISGVDHGALVTRILPASPAADAGLLTSDIILKANNQPVSSAEDFERITNKLKPGSDVVLQVATLNPRTRKMIMRFVSFTLP